MKKVFLAASALGLLSTGIAVPAAAGEIVTAPHQVAVQYNDLNLQSASGKQILKYRLEVAARSVCPDDSARDLVTKNAGKACVKRAVGDAMAEVNERQLASAAAVKGDRG